jgi:hypothetical protein
MGFHNILLYTQQQADYILTDIYKFVYTFVDNIIIASKSLKEYISHLYYIFTRLIEHNIALCPDKCFVSYLSATMLSHKVDAFGLSTTKECLEAITKLTFPETLQQLEYYLGMAR